LLIENIEDVQYSEYSERNLRDIGVCRLVNLFWPLERYIAAKYEYEHHGDSSQDIFLTF
jgi:hypothetical protein